MKVAHTTGAQFPNLWKHLKGLQGPSVATEKLRPIEDLNAGRIRRKRRPEYVRLAERIANVASTWPHTENLEPYLRVSRQLISSIDIWYTTTFLVEIEARVTKRIIYQKKLD